MTLEYTERPAKRSRTVFAPGLFAKEAALQAEIACSKPYKHGCLPALFDDTLLRRVRHEIMDNLHFTEKETDIYKLFQSGDLRNLSGLGIDDRARFSWLWDLREALYSQQFRDFISSVTGCGPLSGVKEDLSINVYHKSCHLLTHDDVIGSRKVSFILYMPDPDERWRYPEWGGALRLYDTVEPNVPQRDWCKVVPPKWNQFAFFVVQPGVSFHDVEEVYVDRERMSVQGWFHIPQPGEQTYSPEPEVDSSARSTLQMLETAVVAKHDFPKRNFVPIADPTAELTAADTAYLAQYMTPALLTPASIAVLADHFCSESQLEIRDFLNPAYARLAFKTIDSADMDSVPQTAAEVDALVGWKLAGPPHKARYMYLDGRPTYSAESKPSPSSFSNTDGLDPAAKQLHNLAGMFSSRAFTAWLRCVTSLDLLASRVLARRFRPALDYTLATGGDQISNTADTDAGTCMGALEATLGLTPTRGWAGGAYGGYEATLLTATSSDDNDNDPAVYRSANSGDEDVLATAASWNTFSLVLRDDPAGVLRFVKYVSGLAPGSRWDVAGEWQVALDEDEDEDELE